MFIRALFLWFFSISWAGFAQPFRAHSVLSEGTFFQLKIEKTGLYQLDAAFLASMGINVAQLQPARLKLFGQSAGMLPQPNSAPAPDDLAQIPIWVSGQADGKFDAQDRIVFFAQGADVEEADTVKRELSVAHHLYDRFAFYYLQIDGETGLRIAEKPRVQSVVADTIREFDAVVAHRSALKNLIFSGRNWVGENFSGQANAVRVFSFPHLLISPHAPVRLSVSVVSTTAAPTELGFTLNNAALGQLALPRVNRSAYGWQGEARTGQFSLPAETLPTLDGLRLRVADLSESTSGLYLERFALQFRQQLVWAGNPLVIRSFESVGKGAVRYELAEGGAADIWDITDPMHPAQVPSDWQGGRRVWLDRPNGQLHTFAAFDRAQLPLPLSGKAVPNQDLHGLAPANLLILTHPLFVEQAQRLAEFRRTHDGLSAHVVTTEQVFHEFSAGRQDVTAIRNFVRSLYAKGQLKYILLFGDASFDYQHHAATPATNTNFVPTYQSRNSLHNIHSYASDDYYAFMEAHEGEWPEQGNNLSDHTMELGVGRLPVKSAAEAQAVVDKLIHYSQHPDSQGDWRLNLAFFADDGDANKHQLQSDYLAEWVEKNAPVFNPHRFFMDRYPQEKISNGRERSAAMTALLKREMNEGNLILDYIGHGSETAWADEVIFTSQQIPELNNRNHLPLMLTATCEFGRFDDWRRQSAAEELVLHPNGGAIALLTTTRPVFFTTNFLLSQAFYRAVFQKVEGEWPRLGDVFRATKNAAISDLINRNFSLLGDPSMRLNYPQDSVAVTRISGGPLIETDTLNLQTVTLEGEIRTGGLIDSGFAGRLRYTVWDEPSEAQTLGSQGAQTVMAFRNRERLIVSGLVPVENGRFQATLLLPEQLVGENGRGKISWYADHATAPRDAAGQLMTIVLPDTANVVRDSLPPLVTFEVHGQPLANNGKIPDGADLTIRFADASGIRLWQGNAPDLLATLIGQRRLPLSLSEFYIPDVGTFQSGEVQILMDGVGEGRYQLEVYASDLAGNRDTTRLVFYRVKTLPALAYPNPVAAGQVGQVELWLPASDEAAKSLVQVFDLQGNIVFSTAQSWPATDGQTVSVPVAFPSTIPNGLYLYRLTLRTAEGSEQVHTGRWVVE